MAFDASAFASSTQEEVTIDLGARHGNARRARLDTERHLQFFRQVARSKEAVTISLKSSVAKLAESRALLARINDLLRR